MFFEAIVSQFSFLGLNSQLVESVYFSTWKICIVNHSQFSAWNTSTSFFSFKLSNNLPIHIFLSWWTMECTPENFFFVLFYFSKTGKQYIHGLKIFQKITYGLFTTRLFPTYTFLWTRQRQRTFFTTIFTHGFTHWKVAIATLCVLCVANSRSSDS